ncbi:filament-like plant protein 3, partial [Trifolium medium]|nr:filament-like plant protein 3 [Trifolium medium]
KMTDKKRWLWKRKSSEKSSGEAESSGSVSSHSERYSDEQVGSACNGHVAIFHKHDKVFFAFDFYLSFLISVFVSPKLESRKYQKNLLMEAVIHLMSPQKL